MAKFKLNKKEQRLRRAKRTRKKIEELNVPCVTVHKTPRHIRVQLIYQGKALAVASTLQKNIRAQVKYTGNVEAAKVVGQSIAQEIKRLNITKLAFDRSGFKYHGRIKALADAMREAGVTI